ncbi:ESPR domain-containing protein, partial [Chromobacterium aquaticum]
MNKTYSLLWNPLQQCWQVGSELKRARGKAGSGRRWQGRLLAALG